MFAHVIFIENYIGRNRIRGTSGQFDQTTTYAECNECINLTLPRPFLRVFFFQNYTATFHANCRNCSTGRADSSLRHSVIEGERRDGELLVSFGKLHSSLSYSKLISNRLHAVSQKSRERSTTPRTLLTRCATPCRRLTL